MKGSVYEFRDSGRGHDDLPQLYELAKQFNLLNLPGDKRVLGDMIARSVDSFAGGLSKADSEYVFVLEDTDESRIVGSSLVMAKHGNEEVPHSAFKIFKRSHFSDDLGIGFIHQVLRFQLDTDGPTEIGAFSSTKPTVAVPSAWANRFRSRAFSTSACTPNVSRIASLRTDSAAHRRRAQRILGGPRATLHGIELPRGGSAFAKSQRIYREPLSGRRHLPRASGFKGAHGSRPGGRGDSARAALARKHRLFVPRRSRSVRRWASLRLRHPRCSAHQNGRRLKVAEFKDASYKQSFLIGNPHEDFRSALVPSDIRGDEIALAPKMAEVLQVEVGEEVFVSPFDYPRRKE